MPWIRALTLVAFPGKNVTQADSNPARESSQLGEAGFPLSATTVALLRGASLNFEAYDSRASATD